MENIFEKKVSRADIRYQPLCKDMIEAMYMGDFSDPKEREMLIKILNNYGETRN